MNVLFICRGNVGRSQIAESFFNKLSRYHATSAGARVGKYEGQSINFEGRGEFAVHCMKELGYDLSDKTSKQLTQKMVETADKVVVIMEEHEREMLPGYVTDSQKAAYWDVEDGAGKNYEFYITMRDKIENLVEKLVK